MESQLRTVTGETASIMEGTIAQPTVGTFQTQQEVWVAKIADECILGVDFLQQQEERVLHIGNEEVSLHKPQAV